MSQYTRFVQQLECKLNCWKEINIQAIIQGNTVHPHIATLLGIYTCMGSHISLSLSTQSHEQTFSLVHRILSSIATYTQSIHSTLFLHHLVKQRNNYYSYSYSYNIQLLVPWKKATQRYPILSTQRSANLHDINTLVLFHA